jgi:chorismate mutase
LIRRGRPEWAAFAFQEEHMEQTLREIAGPLFFALLSLYDRDAEAESVQLLRDALASGGVTDPIAKDVLRSIVFASEATTA